jgi:hypothetical protein
MVLFTRRLLMVTGAIAVMGMALVGQARAATIDVLWYTGGVVSPSGYEATLTGLVAQAATAPITVQNTWNLTFWSGGAMPVGNFDVLVTASQSGPWSTFPNYTDLVNTINAAGGPDNFFGDRIMVSGQDADFHYINHPGSLNFDGPQGFLINAINWAGSGDGLGAVILDANPIFSLLDGL